MRKACLQQKAKEDVREIALYIADDNLKAAEAFRMALERARLTLADIYQRQEGPMTLAIEEEVEIFRVLHGARDIPALFL
jgi:plasmid stabilization system protein ParE